MPQVKTLNREGLLKRAVIKQVQLDENSAVCIRALPASMIVSGADGSNEVFETSNLLVHSLCDEEGKLLFSGDEKAETMTIDHLALKKLLEAIVELNGLKAKPDGEESEPEKN